MSQSPHKRTLLKDVENQDKIGLLMKEIRDNQVESPVRDSIDNKKFNTAQQSPVQSKQAQRDYLHRRHQSEVTENLQHPKQLKKQIPQFIPQNDSTFSPTNFGLGGVERKTLSNFQSINGRSIQYSHDQMQNSIRPIQLQGIGPNDHYMTETKKQFSSFQMKGLKNSNVSQQKDRYYSVENRKIDNGKRLKAQEDKDYLIHQSFHNQNSAAMDATLTRRMIETYNVQSLQKAIGQQVISNTNQVSDKLQKLISCNNQEGSDKLNSTLMEWTPCRFSSIGWKYQPAGTKQNHLHHPNKGNSIGFQQTFTSSFEPQSKTMSNFNQSFQSQTERTQQNTFQSSYKEQFQNRSNIGQSMNKAASPEVVKQLKANMEYGSPPLPHLQVTRIAFNKSKNDMNKSFDKSFDQIVKSSNQQADQEFNLKVNSTMLSPSKEKTLKFNVQTLDGIFPSNSSKLNHNSENPLKIMQQQQASGLNISTWAGMRIKDGGYEHFGKMRDGTTDWESVYYKSGLFKHIK
eukprot:403342970